MALGSLPALGVQTPQINTLGNFEAARANAVQAKTAQMQQQSIALDQKRKSMEGIYMMSAGLLRDGDVNSQEWEDALNMMEQSGADPEFVKTLRGKPELAQVLAKGSGEALKFGQDERQLDMQIEKMAQDLELATQDMAVKREGMGIQKDELGLRREELTLKGDQPLSASPGETLLDPKTRKPFYTAPTAADAKAPDIISIFKDGAEQKGYMGPVDDAHPDGFYPVGGPKGADQADSFGNEKDLFQQYSGSDPVKTYEIVKSSYERVRESAAQQTGAGDMGLIYGYMRMLDPGSVVRENEFAMAAQAGDYGEQIQGFVSRIINGQRLPETQRQEFVRNAEALYNQTAGNLLDINSQFAERAKAAGVDPTRFVREPEVYKPIGADKKADTNGDGVTDWTDYFD